jgi:EAL domain-containing protein (putative c-di-GMP-specific phosphodiesterase class I)
MHLTASIGVAHVETAGDVDLRQGADDAIWVAKSQGGNKTVVFMRSMLADRKDLAEMEEALRHAIASDDEISLAYQPVVGIADDCVVAVEVLARWSHPRFGEISPGRFIPLAEGRGLIESLGRKVMTMAIAQAKKWRENPMHEAYLTHINFSPVQFTAGDVIAEFAALLGADGLKTSDFCIEVTEGAFTDAHAIRGLEEARRMGFSVTMDDFGVGYSCLAQLPRLPLVSVKLDRSFILNAAEDAGEAVMLGSIVQLAHAQNLLVIAEGIETEGQLSLTAQAGCDAIQGYYCARPMSALAFEQWLLDRSPIPSHIFVS